MTKFARTIPKVTFFLVLLAALAAPTYASIAYSSCSNGCDSSGTYPVWRSAPGSAGLTFSMSADTFAPGLLNSGVYLDPTGTIFTGYSGVSIDSLSSITGTSFLEGNNGTGTGIEVLLPPNTYAFAMNITMLGSQFTTVAAELGDHNPNGANFSFNIASNGSVQFFSILSTGTPLTELFFGPIGQGSRLQINDFEIGQESPTPELSSLSLMGSGLLLLGFLRRRIHKPNSAVA